MQIKIVLQMAFATDDRTTGIILPADLNLFLLPVPELRSNFTFYLSCIHIVDLLSTCYFFQVKYFAYTIVLESSRTNLTYVKEKCSLPW